MLKCSGIPAVLVAAIVVVLSVSCRPAAEANPMPVVITMGESEWVLQVPACAGRDGIARFDLTADSTTSEGRAEGDREDERVIQSIVSPATMSDGSYDPGEAKVITNEGEIGTDPFALAVFVSTAKGFAEFDVADIVERVGPSGTAVITGRDQATEGLPEVQWAEEWCDPAP